MKCDMHRREAYIEKEVCKHAKSRGWRQRKMMFVGRRGCPDRWFMRGDGQLVIIEFKDPNGKLSAAQKREIAWLTIHGFNVHVVDSIQQGWEVFDAWDEAAAPVSLAQILKLLRRMENSSVRDVVALLEAAGADAFDPS